MHARRVYGVVGAVSVAVIATLAIVKIASMRAEHVTREPASISPAPLASGPSTPQGAAQGAAMGGDDREVRIAAATHEVSIVLYTADYCGWCRKTKAWLDQRGLAYIERHVDTDASAKREMHAKFRGGGIPAVDIEGELQQGFNPVWLERTIRARAATRVGPG